MVRFALQLTALGLAVMASGCMTPTVTKARMTLGEANIEGMECRRDTPIGTAQPRTICASPEAWAKVDKDARRESELAFEQGRSRANVGAFNRQ